MTYVMDRAAHDRVGWGKVEPGECAGGLSNKRKGGLAVPQLRTRGTSDGVGLLKAIPAQRTAAGRATAAGPVTAAEGRAVGEPVAGAHEVTGADEVTAPAATATVSVTTRTAARWRRAARLLPTPTGTPFTFGYTLVLVATSLFAEYGDPDTVARLLRASSTDVAHLTRTPLLVLVASALWVAGGLFSPYAIGFVFVLTALERRIGAWRAAAVFLVGHVVATLATEIPVGLAVLAGHLPDSSLHRLDYGISFGLMASVGALAGLLTPVARGIVLAWVSAMLLHDLVAFEDPLTDWGHPLALLVGVGCRPLLGLTARRA